jgi:asparagine synthase (glutamine-hydrolysing)
MEGAVCGIAAFVEPHPFPNDQAIRLLKRMLAPQANRGPDGEGLAIEGGIGLGHRLLRILPCPQSGQPMQAADGSLAISFNGEIYNFRSLADGLRQRGVALRTRTDTEVLLELYRADGLGMLARLNGMFAFAIHDRKRRQLVVARDRLGQKPLYVRRQGEGWRFASQIRALLAADNVTPEVNEEALRSYLWALNSFDCSTMYAGISHLPPGTWLCIREDGSVADSGALAPARFEERCTISLPEAAETALGLLRNTLARQSVEADRPACHLSGGLDSSAIAILMPRRVDADLITYSCSYQVDQEDSLPDERAYEEIDHAQSVMQHAQLQGCTVHVGPEDYYADCVDLIETLEEPKGNPCLPHFELARCIGVRHRIFFSGEGADELFGGYIWKLACSEAGSDAIERHLDMLAPCPSDRLSDLLCHAWSDRSVVEEAYRASMIAPDQRPMVDLLMEQDLRHFLGHLLLQADKIAGRFGLEGRYPFLDNDMIDFALALPGHLRFDRNGPTKPVLRMMLKNLLPPAILSRPKIGFVPPEGGWYANKLWPLLSYLLLGRDSFAATLLKPGEMRNLLDEHRAGRCNFRKLLWSLLCLEIWHRRFIQKQAGDQLRDEIQQLRFAMRSGCAL